MPRQEQLKHVVALRPPLQLRTLQEQPLQQVHEVVPRVPQWHPALLVQERTVADALLEEELHPLLRPLLQELREPRALDQFQPHRAQHTDAHERQ